MSLHLRRISVTASEGELSKLDCDILKADIAKLRTRCLIWRRSFGRAIVASGKFATDRRLSFPFRRTIHHQITENEINLTIRPNQEHLFGEPSHATITIEVNQSSSFAYHSRCTSLSSLNAIPMELSRGKIRCVGCSRKLSPAISCQDEWEREPWSELVIDKIFSLIIPKHSRFSKSVEISGGKQTAMI